MEKRFVEYVYIAAALNVCGWFHVKLKLWFLSTNGKDAGCSTFVGLHNNKYYALCCTLVGFRVLYYMHDSIFS